MAQPTKPIHDEAEGAVEEETPRDRKKSDESLSGQLGHRDQNEMLKDNDTDFPEPDAKPEHSGQ
jgi:hypothetical protein